MSDRPISLRQEQHELSLEVKRAQRELLFLERMGAESALSRVYEDIHEDGGEAEMVFFLKTPRGERIRDRLDRDPNRLASRVRFIQGEGEPQGYGVVGYNPVIQTDEETGEDFWAAYDCVRIDTAGDGGARISSGRVTVSHLGGKEDYDKAFDRPVGVSESLPFSVSSIARDLYRRRPAAPSEIS